jgi:hypothetical protein
LLGGIEWYVYGGNVAKRMSGMHIASTMFGGGGRGHKQHRRQCDYTRCDRVNSHNTDL